MPLEEHVAWMNAVTDRCRSHGVEAIQQPINDIDEGHLRSMMFVLILARAGDQDRHPELLSALN